MNLSIIQIPYDCGQHAERMGRGPIHLIDRGLADSLSGVGHDVHPVEIGLGPGLRTEMSAAADLQRMVFRSVTEALEEGRFPILLTGNCNTAALGTVAALESAGRPGTTGVLWFDAHGDFNTPETSPSGFFDGMALSVLTGNSWDALTGSFSGFTPVPEHNVVLIGARDLDGPEEELLWGSAIEMVSVEAIRADGAAGALGPHLDRIARRVSHLYLHLDMDVLDPRSLRANEFAAPGGLTLALLAECLKTALARLPVAALALTAYDPATDRRDRGIEVARTIIGTVVDGLLGAHELQRKSG